MSASKLKNLILLILALVDAFLVVLVVPKQLAVRRQARQETESLLAFFAQEGIALDAPIPDAKTLYASELTCSREAQTELLRALLGSGCKTSENGYQTVFTAPGGSAVLDAEGFFTAEFSASADPLPPAEQAAALLRRMGLEHLTLTQTGSEEDAVTLTAPMELSGLPVFSQPLTFTFRDGTLLRASGQPPVGGEPVRTGRNACVSAQSALIAFLGSRIDTGWVGSHILSVRQGFVTRSAAAAQLITLEPVWEIRTDTGTFLVDGVSQTVTAT